MSKPPCFGDPDLHSNKEAQCVGGYDPVNKTATQSNVWPRCPWFDSCGSVSREAARAYIPTSRVVEGPPRQPATQYTTPSRSYPSYATTPTQQQQQAVQRWSPPDSRLATYLTAEEDIEKTGYVKGLAAEGTRAGLKGMLNQLAHFFDRNPFY